MESSILKPSGFQNSVEKQSLIKSKINMMDSANKNNNLNANNNFELHQISSKNDNSILSNATDKGEISPIK